MVAPLIEIEITWPMLYITMALPAVLMLSNFVFGSCTVSQFVDEVSGKGTVDFGSEESSTSTELTEAQKKRLNAMRTRRRNGKLVVAVLFAVTLTQPFVYLRLANNGRCNIVGALFFGKSLGFGGERCAIEDVLYLGMWLISVVTYVACILSNPSKVGSNSAMMGSKDAPKDSSRSTTEQRNRAPTPFRCGTCNSVVPYHDHHCFFINNCVGKSNYALFFFFMVCVAANSFYIMVNTWWLVVEKGNATEIVLGLFTYGIFFGITGLIVFHLLLCRKGVTTSYLLKNHRGAVARLKFLLS